MTIIDGAKIAAEIVSGLKAKTAPKKFFAAVWVGDDTASESFLKRKEKTAGELGVDFRLYRFSSEITSDALRKEVGRIARHRTCGGVIVQLPLPTQINFQYAMNVIPLEKDIDVLGERALGAFYAGRSAVLPPAAGTVEKILKTKNYNLEPARVAVLGLGPLVGKPIALWLMRKTRDLYLLRRGSDFSTLKNADLVITGTGVPGLVKPEMLKDGAIVIDFGYGASEKRPQIDADGKTGISADKKIKFVGDFDSGQLLQVNGHVFAGAYTPTPGGTGPILVAKLFENFYALNERDDTQ